ncbi:MAG: DUF4007 domain-containing protein [Gammaproteobacteria bacterium]|nr:MAG: DUF4007 domain-containing protein [Gammaproteobacteria bacterium]
MKFDPTKSSFGRHETFALRYSWLSKGFHAIINWPDEKTTPFTSDDATVILGVGKNMVLSIRYWLQACQMIDHVSGEPTEIGTLILDSIEGYDPYLEDEATIWLIHWLLATNPSLATSWYWFFNKFHKPEFTSEELVTALSDFVTEHLVATKRPAISTLKNDAQLLHRMYAQSKGNSRMPLEDALDSPLSLLGLVTQSPGGRRYQSRPLARNGLPLGILGFAITQLFHQRNLRSIPVEELMYSRDDYPAPGAIFRLTENDLVTKLERLVNYIPGVFDIRETAGIHQLYLTKDSRPQAFLAKHYGDVQSEAAA